MRLRCAVLVTTASVFSAFAWGGPTLLYVHDSDGQLGTVNVTDGTTTIIGNMGVVLSDIAFDPDGNLYGISMDNLYSINALTGATTLIGPHNVSGGNALVFAPDGTLYAAGAFTSELYTLNTADGTSNIIGDMGVQSAGDLAFFGGDLYLASDNDDLVRVDLDAEAAGTIVGPFGFSEVLGMAHGGDGVLYGVAGTQIFSIDVNTGAGTLVSDYYGTLLGPAYGSSFTTEAMPAPGGLAVLLGAGWLNTRRRRR